MSETCICGHDRSSTHEAVYPYKCIGCECKGFERKPTPDTCETRIAELERALADALEGMEDMVLYVSEYFRKKWGHDDYIRRARGVLTDGKVVREAIDDYEWLRSGGSVK